MARLSEEKMRKDACRIVNSNKSAASSYLLQNLEKRTVPSTRCRTPLIFHKSDLFLVANEKKNLFCVFKNQFRCTISHTKSMSLFNKKMKNLATLPFHAGLCARVVCLPEGNVNLVQLWPHKSHFLIDG